MCNNTALLQVDRYISGLNNVKLVNTKVTIDIIAKSFADFLNEPIIKLQSPNVKLENRSIKYETLANILMLVAKNNIPRVIIPRNDKSVIIKAKFFTLAMYDFFQRNKSNSIKRVHQHLHPNLHFLKSPLRLSQIQQSFCLKELIVGTRNSPHPI